MTNVTRDVITDLWPLCVSGDASADTQELVRKFLAADPELAARLRAAGDPGGAPPVGLPPLPPSHEMQTMERLKRRLRGPVVLLQLAMIFSCMAFGRIVADTSWDVSPRNFIVVASIAGAFWIAFCVGLYRRRYSVILRARDGVTFRDRRP